MGLTDQVCRIQFIPKNQDTFRSRSSKDTIAQYLNMSEFTIGSSKEANIIYKMKGIHPIHLRVIVRGRELFVEDVFSSAGVTINGKIIKPGDQVPYKAGEFIQLGSSPDIITVEMFRKPVDPRVESQENLMEAEKRANEILREAQSKMEEATRASEKSQELVDAAKEKADEVLSKRKKELELLYEDKVKAAVREGQDRADETSKSILESAQEEVHKLLMEARNEADDLRQRAESEKRETLESKTAVERENEELLRRKEDLEKHIENVLSENEDLLKKNADLIEKAQEIESQYQAVDSEFQNFQKQNEEKREEVLTKLSEAERQYESVKEEFELIQQNCSEARKETDFQVEKRDELQNEIELKREEICSVQAEIDKINESKTRALVQADEVKLAAKSQMDDVKKTLEDEYEKRKEREIERLQKVREREKVRLYQTADDLADAIIGELEFEVAGLNIEPHKVSIQKAVTRIIIEEFELREKTLAEPPSISLEKPKEKESFLAKVPSFKLNRRVAIPLVALAAILSLMAVKGSLFEGEASGFSIARNIQSIGGSASDQWRESYTANILYTEEYLSFTKRQKVNKKLKARLNSFLSSKLKLSKDDIVKFTVQEGMLIWELKKMKSQNKSLSMDKKTAAMMSKEKDMLIPLIEILGGQEKFNRYVSFQRRQFINSKK